MRIVLVRHGKPGAVSRDSIAGRDIGRWVRHYDAAGISRELAPPAAVRDLVASAGYVLASGVRRARESAAWLAASTKDIGLDPELREAALPESLATSVRLSPGVWVALAQSPGG